MMTFIYALIPVILIVGTGRFMAWREMITAAGWRGIERISYVLLFPALIIREIAKAPLDSAPWGLAITLVGAQILLALFGLLARAKTACPPKVRLSRAMCVGPPLSPCLSRGRYLAVKVSPLSRFLRR